MAMRDRQTMPERWLIARSCAPELLAAARKLPRGCGILVLKGVCPKCERRLRTIAARRGLLVTREQRGTARRVHDLAELRSALLARNRQILLSPLYATQSHPDWVPIPRMRAAAFARLAGRSLVALGGMNERRFAKLRPLGFAGWAGISRWTGPRRK